LFAAFGGDCMKHLKDLLENDNIDIDTINSKDEYAINKIKDDLHQIEDDEILLRAYERGINWLLEDVLFADEIGIVVGLVSEELISRGYTLPSFIQMNKNFLEFK
jgi:hypothetical protein